MGRQLKGDDAEAFFEIKPLRGVVRAAHEDHVVERAAEQGHVGQRVLVVALAPHIVVEYAAPVVGDEMSRAEDLGTPAGLDVQLIVEFGALFGSLQKDLL